MLIIAELEFWSNLLFFKRNTISTIANAIIITPNAIAAIETIKKLFLETVSSLEFEFEELEEGIEVGSEVGAVVGSEVGTLVGSEVGSEVGTLVGSEVGSVVGLYGGNSVGSEVEVVSAVITKSTGLGEVL